MSWYNKYRPIKFSEVISQDLIKTVLQNALEKDRIKHAYLFSGPKGVGKTTLARIFANNLNNIEEKPESRLDIIELDAASNTGIDNIRQLIESAKTPPIAGKYRIYIIDEVHMLSKPAMNALLKILEEPPEYLIFLLATTNPEKVIATVLSRLTKLNLSAHTLTDLVNRLREICVLEGVEADEESLNLIAKRANGSQRDSINLLETVVSYGLDKLTITNTSQILGLLGSETLTQVVQKLSTGTITKEFLEGLEKTGIDGETLTAQLLEHLIDLSFASDTSSDFLIDPIVDVLSIKLPTNSVVQYLAVIQNKLKSINGLIATKKKLEIRVKKDELAENTVKIEKKTLISEVFDGNVKSSSFNKNEDSIKELIEIKTENLESINQSQNYPPNPAQKKESLTTSQVLKFLSDLNKDTTIPPPLRMLIPDLDVESILENKILLSVSNGFLFSQINSIKIANFVKEKIFGEFEAAVDFIQRTNISRKSPLEEENFSQVSDDFIPPEDDLVFTKKQTKTELKVDKKVQNPPSGKFYYIYKGLPDNSSTKDIAIVTDPLALPVAKVDAWDKHAQETFDLE